MIADRRILLWGAGSQARIVTAMIDELELGTVSLLFDPVLAEPSFATAIPFTNDASLLLDRLGSISHAVICIGGEHGEVRCTISARLQRRGVDPLSVIHPSALIDGGVTLGSGALVMPRVVVHKFGKIGPQAVLNTACVIDHEVRIGRGVHVMGSAAIAGRVSLGDYVTVGTNATILPDLSIGNRGFVGAGAVVTRDILEAEVAVGTPARPLTEPRRSNHVTVPDEL